MISNNVQYLYSLDGRLAAKRVNSENDLLYGEKERIKANFDYSVSVEDNFYNIPGLDGNWAFVGDGRIDTGSNECQFKTIEDLTIEEVMALYNGLYSADPNSHIPTSELQKWFEAHGVTDAVINNNAKDEYGRTSQSVTFTFEGKSYEWNQVSYEAVNSYYGYNSGISDREDVDGFGHTVHVNNAQELRAALLKYAEDRDYLIVIDSDIDMSGIEWEPIPKLSASIMGGEHTISNLTIKGDGKYVGLFGEIDDYGQVNDLTFENATVTNASTAYNSYTGVLAGRISMGRCKEVHINNSTVTGGGCAGMMAGEFDCAFPASKVKYDILYRCTINNCTVSGDYATGGVVGYGKNSYGQGTIISNVTVNGGQWAGGFAGSVDYNGELSCPGGTFTNVTINGGYHEKTTLGAGGIAGRIGANNKGVTSFWQDTISQSVIDMEKNITINNAYAAGILVGWYCELDSETGQVTRNCNSGVGGHVNGRPFVGKAGIDEVNTVANYVGKASDVPPNEFLQEFAKAYNLTPVPNMAGMCYKDSNGVLYFMSGGMLYASDWDKSLDVYKKWLCQGGGSNVNIEDAEAYMGRVDSHGYPMNPNYAYWELGDDGKMHSYSVGLRGLAAFFNMVKAGEVDYILSNLGAVNYYIKDGSDTEASGQRKGSETFEEIYYQTADGKWHKLTRSANACLYNPRVYLETGILQTADFNDYGTFTFEEYMRAFCGTPETIQLTGGPEDNYEHRVPWFCVEDLSYEEVYEQISDNFPLQPPYNSGYNDDLDDAFVLTLQEMFTGIEGIDLDPHPENATFEDYQNMLVLINFLKAEISGNDTAWTTYRYNFFFEGVDFVEALTNIPGGIELTEANFEQYKHLIPLLDKEQVVAKVMEKLSLYSAQIEGVTKDSNGKPVLRDWLSALLKAVGAKNVNIISEGMDAGGTTYSYAYVSPAFISFDLNGSNYKVGVCPTAKGMAPPQSAIISAEEVEDLRNYMPADEFQRVLNIYFTPIYTVDGKVQTYMFSWTADITGYKYNLSRELPKGVTLSLGFDTRWRGDRPPFTCTGFQELVEWVKTHDVAAACQMYDDLRNENYDGKYEITQEVLALGLSQEVLDWYFESNGSISFRKDPDVDFPVLTTVPALIAYAKSHDLNAEFAACMEKKNAIEAERAAQEAASSDDGANAKERQTYVSLRYSELKAELQENSIAINYLAWNYSLYADKYIKGSITKQEFETEILRILEEAKAKITNPGKNDSINEERGCTSDPWWDDDDNEDDDYYTPSSAPGFEPQNEEEAGIAIEAAKEYDKANLLQAFVEKYQEELSEYPEAVDKFKAQASVIIDRYINQEITKGELKKLVESAFEEVLADARNSGGTNAPEAYVPDGFEGDTPPSDEPEDTPPSDEPDDTLPSDEPGDTPPSDDPGDVPPTTPSPQVKPRIFPRKRPIDIVLGNIDGRRPIDISILNDLDGRVRPFEPIDPTLRDDEDVKIVPTEDDETVDETPETSEEPEELMTSEDYKHEAKDNVEELQKKVGNVIYENGVYYNTFNNKRYNYVWDPYEHKWLTFDPSDMTNGKANDSANKTLMRIQRILAVLRQGLVFTTNPDVCKDKDGNYYDYDESSGIFVKRS